MSKDPLLRRTAVSTVAQATQALRGLFPLLVARIAGAPVLGVVSVAWSWVDLLSKFATWGLDQATTIAVADAARRSATVSPSRVLDRALALGMFRAGLLAGGVSLTIGLAAPAGVTPAAVLLLVWVLPFVVAFRIANGASWGLGLLHHSILSKGLAESAVTVVAFLVFWTVGLEWRAPLLAIICGYGAAAAVAWRLVSRALGADRAVPTSGAPDALGRARWIGASDLIYLANMRLDVIMLGLVVAAGDAGLTLATVGAYAAAVEIGFATKKVRSVFEPIFLRDLASGDTEQAQRTQAWQITAQLGAFGFLWLAMPLILALFGPAFDVAVPWARVLLAANVLNGFLSTDSAMNVLVPATNVGVGAGGLVVNVLLNLLLIPRFGAVGAAISTTTAFGLQAAARLVVLQRAGLRVPHSRLARIGGRFVAVFLPAVWLATLGPAGRGQTALAAVLYILFYGAWTVVAAGLPEVRQAMRRWGRR